MKRVLMLVYNNISHDARVLREARTLANAGYSVKILGHRGAYNRSLEFEQLEDNLTLKRITFVINVYIFQNQILKNLLRVINYIYFYIKAFGYCLKTPPQIIHAHDINMLPLALLLKKRLCIPLIYDAHEISFDREGYKKISFLIKILESYCIRRCDRVLTTTLMRAEYLSKVYDIKLPDVLQNRPELNTTSTSSIKPNMIREHLKITNNANPIILYQGGLSHGRGLLNLLEWTAEYPSINLVFVGDGELKTTLLEAAKKYSNVFFIEKLSLKKLPLYTASADIGVQLLQNTCFNHYSTDSNKLFEYAAAGLPVIASDFPEIRKIIEEFRFGLLVDPESKTSYTEALNKLLQDNNLYQDLKKHAVEFRKDYSWSSIEQKLISLYSQF